MKPVPEDRFVELVEQALEELPEPFRERFDNVAVVVEDEHPEEPDLLGIYEGVPLIDRWDYSGALPDRVTIFRLALCAYSRDEEELVEEVKITVVHELAHHLGIDDDRLHELGWA